MFEFITNLTNYGPKSFKGKSVKEILGMTSSKVPTDFFTDAYTQAHMQDFIDADLSAEQENAIDLLSDLKAKEANIIPKCYTKQQKRMLKQAQAQAQAKQEQEQQAPRQAEAPKKETQQMQEEGQAQREEEEQGQMQEEGQGQADTGEADTGGQKGGRRRKGTKKGKRSRTKRSRTKRSRTKRSRKGKKSMHSRKSKRVRFDV